MCLNSEPFSCSPGWVLKLFMVLPEMTKWMLGECLNKAPTWASLLNYAWALCDFTPGEGISTTSLKKKKSAARKKQNFPKIFECWQQILASQWITSLYKCVCVCDLNSQNLQFCDPKIGFTCLIFQMSMAKCQASRQPSLSQDPRVVDTGPWKGPLTCWLQPAGRAGDRSWLEFFLFCRVCAWMLMASRMEERWQDW